MGQALLSANGCDGEDTAGGCDGGDGEDTAGVMSNE